jgi:hypothetical protein
MKFHKSATSLLLNIAGNAFIAFISVIIVIVIVISAGPAFSEKNKDDAARDENDGSGAVLEIKDFIEIDNMVNTYTKQDLPDAFKKNELRNNLKLKYGTENFYFKTAMNAYVTPNIVNGQANEQYVYRNSFFIDRNLTVLDKSYRMDFQELYLNIGSDKNKVRVGNQIYGWGTSDAINPVSYINPTDNTELLFRDDDENKRGVPSLSWLTFFGDYTLELVFIPMQIPALNARQGNFWALKYKLGAFPVIIDQPDAMDIKASNFGYAGKFSGSILGLDISLCGFHGPDKDAAIRPIKTTYTPNGQIGFYVKPEYYDVTAMGVALSKSIDKFVIQTEVSYSPDKTGVQKLKPSGLPSFPFEVKKSQFISYSAGFNYFIPVNKLIKSREGETIFTAEWTQSKFLDDGITPPLLTNLVITRLDDNYLDNKLKFSLTGLSKQSISDILSCRKSPSIFITDSPSISHMRIYLGTMSR